MTSPLSAQTFTIIGGLRQQVQVQSCCPSPLSGVQRILIELIFFFIIDAQSQVAGLRRLIDRSNGIGGIFCLIGGKGEPLGLLTNGLAFQLGIQRNLLGTLPLASPSHLCHFGLLRLRAGGRCTLRPRAAPTAAWRFLPAGGQRQQQRGRQHQGYQILFVILCSPFRYSLLFLRHPGSRSLSFGIISGLLGPVGCHIAIIGPGICSCLFFMEDGPILCLILPPGPLICLPPGDPDRSWRPERWSHDPIPHRFSGAVCKALHHTARLRGACRCCGPRFTPAEKD